MNNQDNWRAPDTQETELLAYYFKEKDKINNVFFKVWICFGIFGMIGSAISIIKSVIEEPKDGFYLIFSGIIGILIIYLFFVKLGLYIYTKALKRELTALENNQVEIYIAKALGKERRISRLSSNGHRVKHNYYIKVRYQNNAADYIEAPVITQSFEYNKINEGDVVYIISYNKQHLSDYMFVVNGYWFNEIEDEKEKKSQ